MKSMDSISKLLVISGITLVSCGLIWHFTGGKIPIGKLPGDLRFESENTKIYIPITTSIIMSVIMTLISYFFKK